jgi:DNA-binding CsgD family transcriptional regulator
VGRLIQPGLGGLPAHTSAAVGPGRPYEAWRREVSQSPHIHQPRAALSFTPRERQILAQLPGGATYQTIASHLGISPHTVDTYMRRLRVKLGVTNRTQLAVLAIQLGFFSTASSAARTETGATDGFKRIRVGGPMQD